MKKTLLALTAPFLLIDACSSARLTRKEINNEETVAITDTIYKAHESIRQSGNDPKKQIVVRELSNGEFDLSTRFDPEIKDHYKKGIIQIKITPDL